MERFVGYICMALLSVCLLGGVVSCDKKPAKPPIDLNKKDDKCLSIAYDEYLGVKTIPVRLNGMTVDMIYDTGCSGVSISLNEIQMLDNKGKLDYDDILEGSQSQIADGSIVKEGRIRLKTLEIGEGKHKITLHNVVAGVVLNQTAPLLLGNTVLDELKKIEVDNIRKRINFYKK